MYQRTACRDVRSIYPIGSRTGKDLEDRLAVTFFLQPHLIRWRVQDACFLRRSPMPRWPSLVPVAALLLVAIGIFATARGASRSTAIPALASAVPLAAVPGKVTAVFAGGCFWGTQSVFERVKGVLNTTAGYAGGSADTATYSQVSSETTGHAESVRVVYDPAQITYGQLLRIFFS